MAGPHPPGAALGATFSLPRPERGPPPQPDLAGPCASASGRPTASVGDRRGRRRGTVVPPAAGGAARSRPATDSDRAWSRSHPRSAAVPGPPGPRRPSPRPGPRRCGGAGAARRRPTAEGRPGSAPRAFALLLAARVGSHGLAPPRRRLAGGSRPSRRPARPRPWRAPRARPAERFPSSALCDRDLVRGALVASAPGRRPCSLRTEQGKPSGSPDPGRSSSGRAGGPSGLVDHRGRAGPSNPHGGRWGLDDLARVGTGSPARRRSTSRGGPRGREHAAVPHPDRENASCDSRAPRSPSSGSCSRAVGPSRVDGPPASGAVHAERRGAAVPARAERVFADSATGST